MLTFRYRIHMWPIFLLLLAASSSGTALEDNIQGNSKDYEPDIEPYENVLGQTERPIFDYRKNGIRIDMKVVPVSENQTVIEGQTEEQFPKFPLKDIGRCIIDLSFICVEKRIARFLQAVGELREISLLGQSVRLVKTRVLKANRRSAVNDVNEVIDRSIDDFFDTFVLRITLPKWNGSHEQSQIDLMFDGSAVAEGRGKGGGGGGGGKGGGKCKKMMMMGMMAMKLKIIAIASLKGMMMSGMSLMLTMAMMASKFMKGGGGYSGGGGGGQLKEIVLLTKATGGSAPGDSYGAPPPAPSYGVPSGGDWQGGGGGGWGRSFDRRINLPVYRRFNAVERDSLKNIIPLIGETVSHNESPEFQKSYESITPVPLSFNKSEIANNAKNDTKNEEGFNLETSEYVESNHQVSKSNVLGTVYGNEWLATDDKFPARIIAKDQQVLQGL